METHNIKPEVEPQAEPDKGLQLQAGTTLIERYLIQGILGIGGMGAVYQARDLHFPNVVKFVAVKEMVNRAHDPIVRKTIVQNFEREANLLASLDHRAIPRIYDYFSKQERSYLIIEFIQGEDLETLVTQHENFIHQERVISWAIELCDVLEYLHNHKPEVIIFRDIKPSNVMVNKQDHIVLIDFGIAKHFQSGQKGTMIGTEGYSPPEQYRGEATPQADIYALGATLHHMLTRRDPRLEPPFSFHERPISQINPEVSSALEDVVDKSLQYNPEDRFSNAAEMKEALLTVARDSGIISKISMPSVGRFSRESEIQPIWEFECEDEIRGSPNYYKGVVFIGCYDNNMYALEGEKGKFIWKYATDGGIVSKPAAYENNLFFGSEDHRLHAIYLKTGKVNWTYFTNGPVRSSPHIAEGHIFIGSDDTFLHAVNTMTGRHAWKVDCGSPIRSTPVVFEDCIYFGTEAGDFYCLDYRGSIKWRYKAKRGVTSSPVISQDVVYFAALDSILYALDAKTGWVIWRFRLAKPSISSPFFHDGMLFIGSVDGSQNQVTGSAIIHNDSLYCGSIDGGLYCIEYDTGRVRWKFQTKGPITGTPCAHENLIYVGSTDHRMYAFLA